MTELNKARASIPLVQDPRVVQKTREWPFFLLEPGAGVIFLGAVLEPKKLKRIILWLLSLGAGTALAAQPSRILKLFSVLSVGFSLLPFGEGKYLRFFFGMATVMRALRVIEVLMNPDFFEEKGAMYTVKFCFLYHDIRRASYLGNATEKQEAEQQAMLDIGKNAAALLAVIGLFKIPALVQNKMGLTVLSMFRFYYFISMVEAGYRFQLCTFSIRAPKCFDEPWKSESVAEFWGQRWNLAIAQQLRNVFFKPLAEAGYRTAGEFAVFMASSGLHMIPIVSLGGSAQGIMTTASFFLLQPFMIALEKRFGLRGRVWVQVALWSTAPLFAIPLHEVM